MKLQACCVCLRAFQVKSENQTVPVPIYSLWQCCHTCSLPKCQSEETCHSHAQESQWSLGLSYPHSEYRQRRGDLRWSWGFFCSYNSSQISQTPEFQQGTISTWKKRIHSRKSRYVIALNTDLICSK